jgi:hypothetical protein
MQKIVDLQRNRGKEQIVRVKKLNHIAIELIGVTL